jgi:hypothetical protein
MATAQITINGYSNPGAQNVQLGGTFFNGNPADGSGNVEASQINVDVTATNTTLVALGSLATYCVDLFHYINQQTYTYNVTTLTNGPVSDGNGSQTTWTSKQVQYITALLEANQIDYASTGATDTAAIQLAIWDVEYGSDSNGNVSNLSSGTQFTASNNATVISDAQTYLNKVTSGATGWLDSPSYTAMELSGASPTSQNLVFLVAGNGNGGNSVGTPEPGTVGLLGAGLAGLWAAARRRRV